MVKTHEQQVPHVRVSVLIRLKSPKIVGIAVKIAVKIGYRKGLVHCCLLVFVTFPVEWQEPFLFVWYHDFRCVSSVLLSRLL
jgi:hypothetical protein